MVLHDVVQSSLIVRFTELGAMRAERIQQS